MNLLNATHISASQKITGEKNQERMQRNRYHSEKYWWEESLKEKKINHQPGSEAGYCKRILLAYTSSEAGSNERGDIGGKRSTALKQRIPNF